MEGAGEVLERTAQECDCQVDGRRVLLAEGPAWAKARRAEAWSVWGVWQGGFAGSGLVQRVGVGPVC